MEGTAATLMRPRVWRHHENREHRPSTNLPSLGSLLDEKKSCMSGPVVLNQVAISPPKDILETFSLPQGGGHDQHLVGRGQGSCHYPRMPGPPAPNNYVAPNVNMLSVCETHRESGHSQFGCFLQLGTLPTVAAPTTHTPSRGGVKMLGRKHSQASVHLQWLP